MKNDRLTVCTKYILDMMFYGGCLVTVSVPLLFKFYGKYNTRFAIFYVELCILFILSGIFAVLLIGELRKMFKSVLADDCFIRENVTSLRKMGTYSFIIALITMCRITLYLTPAVLVVILVFVIAGLFSKVLALVFDKAVTYKMENDLTI